MEEWKVKIIDVGYTVDRHVFIYRKTFGGKVQIMRGDTMETVDDGVAVKPSFCMSPELLQIFANSLDEIGINPKQGFLEGKIEATEKHLEDMRKLVFEDEIIISGTEQKK